MNIMLLLAARGRAQPRKGLGADKYAAVAIIFATMIVPICMLTALVIDYGFVMQTKSQLDLAADAAALAAARTAGSGYAAGQQQSNPSGCGNASGYLAEGNLAGNQWFSAQAGNVPHALSYSGTNNGLSKRADIYSHRFVHGASVRNDGGHFQMD